MTYSNLANQIRKCRSCEAFNWPVAVDPLPATLVSIPVKVLFVGENPSWADDQPEPFSQSTISGKALDKHYLEPLSLKRSDVWITDLIKCRYPRTPIDIYHNKDASSQLIQRVASQCAQQWLIQEIRFAQPSIIVTLSHREVYERFCKTFSNDMRKPFDEIAGTPLSVQIDGRQVFLFPMIHPDISRPEGDGDNRKIRTRNIWAKRHANEHIPALRDLLQEINQRAHGS